MSVLLAEVYNDLAAGKTMISFAVALPHGEPA